MNNTNKHITPWSGMDVQRYLNGELSAREMHDLEQLALDDPFLADALEGLQTQPHEILHQDLAGLRSRLDARVTTKRKTAIWPFIRIAAAFILLVGLGYTAITLTGGKSKLNVDISRADSLPTPPVAASTTPSALSSPPAPLTSTPSKQPAAKSDSSITSSSFASNLTSPAKPSPAEPKISKAKITQGIISEHTDSLHVTAPAADLAYNKAPAAADKEAYLPSDLVAFSGRVLDLNQRPLAGASLTYKSNTVGSVTGVVTDRKGYFNLYVPQKDSASQLTIAMDGYEETRYFLNTGDRTGNTIFLRQKPAALEQVVVTGLGAKRKEFLAAPPSDDPEKLDSLWLNTAPAMGRIAYLNYLTTARKTLPVDSTIHGTESISFLVDKKGTLTEFKIERSLSPAHDAGVIRMVTEGPPWKMVHGRTARAMVNISF